MDISEKVAYLRGLAEGLKISDSSNEGKMLLSILDVLSEMADAIDSLEFDVDIINDEIESFDEDIDFLMDENFSDLDSGHPSIIRRSQLPDVYYDDFEGEIYEIVCPECQEHILLDEEMLDEGEVLCPECSSVLELDFEEVFDGEEDYVLEDDSDKE